MEITLSDEALLGDLLAFLPAEGCIAYDSVAPKLWGRITASVRDTGCS